MPAGQGGSCWLVVTGTANPLPESALSLYPFRPTRGALCNELPPFVLWHSGREDAAGQRPRSFCSMPLQGNADAVLVKVVWQRFGFSVRHGDRRLCGGRAGRTAGQSRTGRCAGPVRPGRAIPVWPRCGTGMRLWHSRGFRRPLSRATPMARANWAPCTSRDGAWPGTRGSSFSGRARPRNRAMPLPRPIWAGLTKRVGGWAGMPVGRRMVRQGLSGAARDGGGRASGSPVQSGQYVSHGLGPAQR